MNEDIELGSHLPALKKDILTDEELHEWRYPVAWRLVLDLLLVWFQLVLAVAVYVAYPHWGTFAAAFTLVAGGQHGLYLVAHEFVHYLGIPRSRRWNDFIGSWFFGCPVGLPLAVFRHRHFKHHRHFSSARDTKTVYRREIRGFRLIWELARSLTGIDFVLHVFELRSQEKKAVKEGMEPMPPVWKTLPPLVLVQGIVFGIFWLLGHPWMYVFLWLVPLATLSTLFNKIRALMEHHPLESESGLTPDSGYYRDTSGPYVRTCDASLLERLFVCKINFSFHAEHHLWPSVSYQFLPRLRKRLLEKGRLDDPCLGHEATYLSTLWKLWRPPAVAGNPKNTGDAVLEQVHGGERGPVSTS